MSELEKYKYKFIKFDIVEFYPSISEELLDKAIKFSRQYIDVNEEEIKIVKHAAKSVLFSDGVVYKKNRKKEESLFDITMGGYHGAEVCELVGLYMLDSLNKVIPDGRVGLYRDDGLAAVEVKNGRQGENIRKELFRCAKTIGLEITVDPAVKITEFLDIEFNLEDHSYRPYRKPNSKIRYIHSASNHPRIIKKQIPKIISNRLSRRSSDESKFREVEKEYSDALRKNGYKEGLRYVKEVKGKKKKRKRKIVWFNPPFCESVKTNVGRKYLELVRKHFSKKNPLHKILNKNSMKVSYRCMPNVDTIISSHNKAVLSKEKIEDRLECNHRNKAECPIKQGKYNCREKDVVYKATVTEENSNKKSTYIGLTSLEFKVRHSVHKSTFPKTVEKTRQTDSRHREDNKVEDSKKSSERETKSEGGGKSWKLRNRNKTVEHAKEKEKCETRLASHLRQLAEKNRKYTVKWEIIKKARSRTNGGKQCKLCDMEVLQIIENQKEKETVTLNKKSEITGACRHESRHLLKNWKKEEPKKEKKIPPRKKIPPKKKRPPRDEGE